MTFCRSRLHGRILHKSRLSDSPLSRFLKLTWGGEGGWHCTGNRVGKQLDNGPDVLIKTAFSECAKSVQFLCNNVMGVQFWS